MNMEIESMDKYEEFLEQPSIKINDEKLNVKQQKELIEHFQNLMGVFDTPVMRSKYRNDSFIMEVLTEARKFRKETGI